MTIGIIGAMQVEMDELKLAMTDKVTHTYSNIEYVSGKIHDINVVAAVSGIGKVFAAICAQTMILKFDIDMVINIGVAGTLCKELCVLDTAIATSVVQHDMDTSPLGDPVGLISGINIVNIPCNAEMVNILEYCTSELNIKYKSGVIASGDQFMSSPERKRYIHNTFDAIAVEMEGASIGQVCYVNKKPFIILRTISDGEGCAMDYNQFVVKAASTSVSIILKFIEKLRTAVENSCSIL